MTKKNLWNIVYQDMKVLKEDMLQIEFWNILLDFWYYSWLYKIYIIKDYDWKKPLEVIEFKDWKLIEEKINLLKSKIINWYYNN